MKTYTNKRLGFKVDVPEDWPLPTRVGLDGVIFRPAPNEALNLLIGLLIPEPPLEVTERALRQYAQDKGYTQVELGGITVGGKEHIWARYHMGLGWTGHLSITTWAKHTGIGFSANRPKTSNRPSSTTNRHWKS